jgi:hypothetical protein
MTLKDILAIQTLVSSGHLTLQHVPTNIDGNPTYRFRVCGLHTAWLEFDFFCDAGDWDYLSAVRVDGVEVADYDKMRNLQQSDWQDSWRDVGKWMPNLPSSYSLRSLDE